MMNTFNNAYYKYKQRSSLEKTAQATWKRMFIKKNKDLRYPEDWILSICSKKLNSSAITEALDSVYELGPSGAHRFLGIDNYDLKSALENIAKNSKRRDLNALRLKFDNTYTDFSIKPEILE